MGSPARWAIYRVKLFIRDFVALGWLEERDRGLAEIERLHFADGFPGTRIVNNGA